MEAENPEIASSTKPTAFPITTEKPVRVVFNEKSAGPLTVLPERSQVLRKTEIVYRHDRPSLWEVTRVRRHAQVFRHRIEDRFSAKPAQRCEEISTD